VTAYAIENCRSVRNYSAFQDILYLNELKDRLACCMSRTPK